MSINNIIKILDKIVRIQSSKLTTEYNESIQELLKDVLKLVVALSKTQHGSMQNKTDEYFWKLCRSLNVSL